MQEARLVYDGSISSDATQRAAPGQCEGTVREVLCELAGRECYDSLGSGRSSPAYHAHILEVAHLSVYEHANFTVRMHGAVESVDTLLALLNRPGVFVLSDPEHPTALRVTMNLRSVLDWGMWETPLGKLPCPSAILGVAHKLAPQVVREEGLELNYVELVAPVHDEECWISLRLSGSRGFSHEQVRHKFRTAVSQRSTRYVDESESSWSMHPVARLVDGELGQRIDAFAEASRTLYRDVADCAHRKLIERGVDRFTARKQARGGARGFLGNALSTSMIFSASVAQWRRMLRMRLSDAADAEIREVFVAILIELRRSCYGDRFAELTLRQSSDGLGRSLT